tara:strand:- start:784 stop:2937 length:2154 start_codon:yes stop_codon:yes gene_type:complete
MAMKALKFKPGIIRDITSLSNENGYVDCDKIRFRNGYPEKLGGWVKFSSNTYQGSARRLHNWVALDGSDFLGIGSHLKYYIEEGQNFNDITPIRFETSAGDVTFTATENSNVLTVNDPGHGSVTNDFVTFSGATSLGGNITDAILNTEHQITRFVSSAKYEVTLSVTATATDASNSGGTNTIGTYQLNTGLDNTVGGTGFGAGQYGGTTSGAVSTIINEGGTFSNSDTTLTVANSNPGHQIATNDFILIEEEILKVTNVSSNNLTVTRAQEGTAAATHADGTTVFLIVGNSSTADDFVGWGDAASVTVAGAQIRTWSHDNFGEDLIINPRDGGLFYWDKSDGTNTRAKELSANTLFATRRSVPTIAKQILVSDIDRHVIAFGCDAINSSSTATAGNGIQDPLLIRFSDQENPSVWFPTTTNTAGDLRLGAGSTFVQAVETKREILVYTDKSLHSMQFIGPPFTFGISQLASNITIMSPASAIATEDVVYWMGLDNFYTHAGQTQQLPCTVKDKVFLDFNLEERDKVVAGINSEFGEVWWFYPSASSSENNKYVIWNYVEQVWYYGDIVRTAWLDRGVRSFPIAANSPSLFNHETGFDDDTTAMASFIESAPMDIGDGEKFLSLRRLIPDLTFTGSVQGSSPSATFTVKARDFPGSDFLQTSDGTATRTATSPVEQFTEKLDYRIRGRSFAIKLASSALGCKFKLGTPRVDIREDGRR